MLTSIRNGDIVYRLRARVERDSIGDEVRSWDNPERTRIPRATLEAPTASASNSSRTVGSVVVLEGERRLLIVGEFDLKPTDRVEAAGEIWRVDGEPGVKRGLVVGTHTAAILKRTASQ